MMQFTVRLRTLGLADVLLGTFHQNGVRFFLAIAVYTGRAMRTGRNRSTKRMGKP
jgi:hypothetical protein